jgi:flagellar biosynthesis chaperone FliJ
MSLTSRLWEKLLFTRRTYRGFVKIIFDILSLEQKLKCPETESFYFRQAIDQHQKRLTAMIGYFNYVREFYNQTSLGTLREQLTHTQTKLKEMEDKIPRATLRVIMTSHLESTVEQLQDYIQLKEVVEKLPDWDQLRMDDELLLRLLG